MARGAGQSWCISLPSLPTYAQAIGRPGSTVCVPVTTRRSSSSAREHPMAHSKTLNGLTGRSCSGQRAGRTIAVQDLTNRFTTHGRYLGRKSHIALLSSHLGWETRVQNYIGSLSTTDYRIFVAPHTHSSEAESMWHELVVQQADWGRLPGETTHEHTVSPDWQVMLSEV